MTTTKQKSGTAKKRERSTVTIVHESMEPYYIIADDMQFQVLKRIPSGHRMPARGYFTTLNGALSKIRHWKVQDNLMQEKEEWDLEEYVEAYATASNTIVESLEKISANYAI